MSKLRLIGDVLYLEGEAVADVRPEIRASLRGWLEDKYSRPFPKRPPDFILQRPKKVSP